MSIPNGNLNGKTAVVTGALGAIGKAVVNALAAEGVQTILLDVMDVPSQNESNAKTGFVKVDLSELGDIARAVEYIKTNYGTVDLLVNVAGILSNNKMTDTTIEEWRRVNAVNLSMRPFYCRRLFCRRCVRKKKGADHRDHVWGMLSGMVTEADWNTWRPDQIIPYIETVVDLFGADRCMLGSDWPVCLLAASCDNTIGIVRQVISGLPKADRRAMISGSAMFAYRLAGRV